MQSTISILKVFLSKILCRKSKTRYKTNMQREDMIKGSLCMTAGFLFQALFGAFLKAATVSASGVWALTISYCFACLIQLLFISKEGFAFLKTKRVWGHLGRVIFGALSTLLYVYSLNLVPLMNATLLLNTAPLLVPIFAIFLLKTKASLKTWIFLLIGFIGVLFILNPNFSSLGSPGNLIGLTSGIIQALAFIFVKMLTSTEPIKRINFYFFFISFCMFVPFALYSWHTPPLEIWIWALCGGITSFLSQLFIVKGYHYADASHVGPFQYASVIFSGIIGWVVWKEIPALNDLIGTLLVILGGALAIMFYTPKIKPPRSSLD